MERVDIYRSDQVLRAGSPVQIVVVPNPPSAGSLGEQMFYARFAVVGTSDQPDVSTTITLPATLKLDDGSSFFPAGTNFQIVLRQ